MKVKHHNTGMNIPSTIIDLQLRCNSDANTRVLNVDEIPYFIYFRIPHGFLSGVMLSLTDIHDGIRKHIDFTQFTKRRGNSSIIEVESRIFEFSLGYHTYMFEFINTITDDVYCLFASVIIQNDNPENRIFIWIDRWR